eukprot:CAMPEP_0202452932 /NCGR_PEP_ID=MMETSP1360-20130828/11035_1 /ASSEMBLY_ACC=CAM_ASM_000848 /TAXON_ID=515479 /ORGANISM="Licmophora paradoxa, Strain CCMP2313" /LENGTH=496 /DNA_ID=CAMNT_0049071901 /DNA_START=40 /DNA_END=1530 /DNA_ORIENTATION=-
MITTGGAGEQQKQHDTASMQQQQQQPTFPPKKKKSKLGRKNKKRGHHSSKNNNIIHQEQRYHQDSWLAKQAADAPLPKDEAIQYEQYKRLRFAMNAAPTPGNGMLLSKQQQKTLKIRGLQVGKDIVKGSNKPRRTQKQQQRQQKSTTITPLNVVDDNTEKLKDEIDFVHSKLKKWQTSMLAYRHRREARQRAIANHTTVQCSCCFGDVAPEETIACREHPQEHHFCRDCIKQYAESQIFGSGNLGAVNPDTKLPSTELKCVHGDGCNAGFDTAVLETVLSEQTMQKYNELQFQALMTQAGIIQNLCTCPKCGYKAELPETQMIFRCPIISCNHESCRKCGEESHIPLRCEEVEKKHETKGRVRVEEAISAAKIRTCPRKGCGKKFIKETGCNKMTCSCGAYVCYICRKEIPKNIGYTHFCQTPLCKHTNCGKCVLTTNDRQDDERAMKEAGIQAAETVQKESAQPVSVNVDEIMGMSSPAVRTRSRAGGTIPVNLT